VNDIKHNKQSLATLERELAETQSLLQKEIDQHKKTQELLRQVEESYGRFVPHQFLKLLGKKNITDVEIGNQTELNMTVLFSDIRNFTSLSESMTPQENFNFINSYLSQMELVIGGCKGIIDKYIGDAIMALFPTKADDSLLGSLGMLRKLKAYNGWRKNSGYRSIQIGIGLNTGLLMLGTVGGANRMDGTVISDVVNQASRLEGLTKIYHTPLLISEHTLNGLVDSSRYCIRFIGRLRVKGKQQPKSVFEVFDNDVQESREGKLTTLKLFEEALEYYHLKELPKVKELLEKCLQLNTGDQPAQVYLAYCQKCLETGEHKNPGEL
jgi:hemerythrin